jgi:hypothetical protein
MPWRGCPQYLQLAADSCDAVLMLSAVLPACSAPPCCPTAISAVAEYTRDKDDNADISSLFLTKEYYPGQPVEIQLYHVSDIKDQEAAESTLEPTVISVPDRFLTKNGMGFTVNIQGEDRRLLLYVAGCVSVAGGCI